MRRMTVFAPLLLLAAVLLPTSAAAKSSSLTFTNPFDASGVSQCTATFNRSSSGVINETNLTCSPGPQNPWAGADVYLQYRPAGKNGKCQASGLVASQPFSTNDSTLGSYFVLGATYTACVYLVNPVIAFGDLAVDSIDGNTTPVIPLSGKYSVCISGVYSVDITKLPPDYILADAKYLSLDSFATPGTDAATNQFVSLGSQWGEVQVNQQFVDWGSYKSSHTYCRVIASTGNTFNVRVFDGQDGVAIDWWYGDNGNSTMQYMITYIGQ